MILEGVSLVRSDNATAVDAAAVVVTAAKLAVGVRNAEAVARSPVENPPVLPPAHDASETRLLDANA